MTFFARSRIKIIPRTERRVQNNISNATKYLLGRLFSFGFLGLAGRRKSVGFFCLSAGQVFLSKQDKRVLQVFIGEADFSTILQILFILSI
ncbi:MAG: hypothetical protein IPJ82_01735 [Lewinellaceae bacterium]|nr:hypothetical protein [Lewinellaceae bacterium]